MVAPVLLSREALHQLVVATTKRLALHHVPGQDRRITAENVYQSGNRWNLPVILDLMEQLLLPGSALQGCDHLDHCLAQIDAGQRILFLAEHAGNFDVPAFFYLVGRASLRYQRILDRLIYIAGRKLNEESEVVKMYTEIFSRIVIVPRRELLGPSHAEGAAERGARLAEEHTAATINRAAFRRMAQLKRNGHIFCLFPLGGRPKGELDNVPVKETTSYLKAFDLAYPIAMVGNPLPATAGPMELEVPIQDRVVFRVGAPLACADYLMASRVAWESAGAPLDFEQFTANRVMDLLRELHRAAADGGGAGT
ncbi:MAG: hypothetical protein COW73_05495 [Nitrospirae bacterium CG18_big_fil_WC_8_21_14_2_50_70_55]|nr:hypothetical protein [Deltaproteobacteria bacterium]PIQ05582.1 MAG: hypothetical protein COW73_05495 [Nitrospirae bacterium CG18_big_fil_WC_8_21_14_2_50_70_55]PIU77444.1 MAG: hypothetical protein COS73_10520 [Nitrospirae bacterium CG06_land_8_20_14_3_00_70_43]PIW83938.1 MAG: hypothetical protein COZ96_00750 [Nitrospirae bacterium CG_4_8_14_3_um_filter_70_85]PIX82258.1 MAG: hypothetical protein COZ33_11600 [Nitrospirae bacterium CG_4_10_14_3_um_filter_70_108]PJB96943.1 MAG: hypothetical prot